jgi:uncharacterized protein YdhG (YjbR/CyaY superfamily)
VISVTGTPLRRLLCSTVAHWDGNGQIIRVPTCPREIRVIGSNAQERISYRIPAFELNGIVVYFAGFKNHIGLYPPVKGDARLARALASYANEKGNLRFPLDEPIPYALVERIAKLRVRQNLAKADANKRKAVG